MYTITILFTIPNKLRLDHSFNMNYFLSHVFYANCKVFVVILEVFLRANHHKVNNIRIHYAHYSLKDLRCV